jgi:hypothetical protein
MATSAIVRAQQIEENILTIRGHRVMIDADLALLYGVPTKSLNLAVRRNLARFPDDFMFQLTADEYASLRFQIETSKGRDTKRQKLAIVEMIISRTANSDPSNHRSAAPVCD